MERRTRLAAYALCIDDQGRILACRIARGYPAQGMWTLPGGGVNFGEDPAAAVLRELTEETGLSGALGGLAFVHSTSGDADTERSRGPWHGVRIVYRVSVTGGDLQDEVDESTDQARWLSTTELHQLPVVDLVRAALAYLSERRSDADA